MIRPAISRYFQNLTVYAASGVTGSWSHTGRFRIRPPARWYSRSPQGFGPVRHIGEDALAGIEALIGCDAAGFPNQPGEQHVPGSDCLPNIMSPLLSPTMMPCSFRCVPARSSSDSVCAAGARQVADRAGATLMSHAFFSCRFLLVIRFAQITLDEPHFTTFAQETSRACTHSTQLGLVSDTGDVIMFSLERPSREKSVSRILPT